jgi:hypothetical protein
MDARAKSELPDVPEAARLEICTTLAQRSHDWGLIDDDTKLRRIAAEASIVRDFLSAALPVLIEQGWKPPEAT